MVPSNFWQEFEARLDARLDAKLDARDARLDARFAEINAQLELNTINARFAPLNARLTRIENSVTNIDNWTKRQDTSLEHEMTHAIETFLINKFQGFITVRPTVFPKELKDANDNTTTEFDGLFVLTDSLAHANILNGSNVSGTVQDPVKSFFVIVEAKQHLDHQTTARKISQHTAITDLLKSIKNNADKVPPNLRHTRLELFQHEVGLYVGGLIIDKDARDTVVAIAQTTPKCGIIELNGARFDVNNIDNDFGAQQYGGKKPRRSFSKSTRGANDGTTSLARA